MECKNCELRQRQFYCENCLRTHIRDFRLQTQHFSSDRDDQVHKAANALASVEGARRIRANVASSQERLDDVLCGLARLRKQNNDKRTRLRTLREHLSTRSASLATAKLFPPPSLEHVPSTSRETQELAALSGALARARSGLVQELVEVFNVVEVGGRPPVGGKAGSKGEWTIGDLILPVPGDIRRYPPDHINAVITHTIHFLGLLTFYLGVKLPFEISWSGKRLGVGHPWIGAGKGAETGNWAKWYAKHPLHLSSAGTATASPASIATVGPQPISDSYTETGAGTGTGASTSSFTTAFAMLLYNVCYLAHTQSVDIPLSQAGDTLSNLWAVCCSPDLGRRSHETTPLLAPPTPASFPLDFAQLLQATTANPASRSRARRSKSSSSAGRRLGAAVGVGRKEEGIVEEEEGWDLVDDVGAGLS